MDLKYTRTVELAELESFATNRASGFMYVRGRRRVGKSWILMSWASKKSNRLYFSGKKDSAKEETILQFAQAWSLYSKTSVLVELRPELLSWDRVFLEVLSYQKEKKTRLVLIFDEIQWIAKEGAGFIGSLKNSWVLFEMTGLISVIICGSSNKFFDDHVGGEEKILRGISTRSAMWVEPIPIKNLKNGFLKDWNDIEIALTYMILGGIPYYLQQIQPDLGFIQALNQALMAKESIFLEEVDEVLMLEFNRAGVQKVKEILGVIGIYGASQAKVRQKLELPTSSVSETFEKLQNYNLLFVDDLSSKLKTKGIEKRYFIKDFYLNFYFTVLKTYIPLIKSNPGGNKLIFSNLINTKGYYIENFTGRAFENFVAYQIENAKENSRIYSKLKLVDANFSVERLLLPEAQIDLVVRHHQDRIVRIIECKWGKEDLSEISHLYNKEFVNSDSSSKPLISTIEHRLNILVKAQKPSSRYIEACKKSRVVLITLRDLFG